MVGPWSGFRALNRKLVRDVWEMKGQAVAIAGVIGAGVAMFVTLMSNFDSLQRTRSTYYEGARFADVFASLKRAPASLEAQIAAIPGVQVVATRVVATVLLDVPGLEEPAAGRLISVPEHGRPPLNNVYLRAGRWVDSLQPDEVIASDMFCEANGLVPGDQVAAIINGRHRLLTIVGIGLSPEFVYAIRPGELFPEQRRFGIFWMGRQGLAAAFDMEGGFNDVSLALALGASSPEVIARLDRLIEPYGGLGAIPQELQSSAWTLDQELTSLQAMGFVAPLLFLSVAAVILNIALTRALALQRPQIAALKALGYSNRELAWHYIKWGLIIAAAGAVLGVMTGGWLGFAMSSLYNRLFRFPSLDYRVSLDVAAASLAGSLVVAALGALSAVRRAVALPPAEAMRPEPPARYRPSVFEGSWSRARLTTVTRMILRGLERHPLRSSMSVVGIGLAVGILFVGLSMLDLIGSFIDQQFTLSMRQDATVSFVEPRSGRVVHDVAHLPGAMYIEPMRSVAVRLRAGHRSRTLAITGTPASPELNRVIDRAGGAIAIPPDGIVLSKILGGILGVSAGDFVGVEVLEGSRPKRLVQVASLVDDAMGLQAYMQVDAVHRLLREGNAISAAALTVDPAALPAFYKQVKLMPAVAGVALREMMLQNFQETMGENMGVSIFFITFFAAVIALGVVYNSARVSLSERARELASLRVLGFTRGEISLILLGELAILTLLALPVGTVMGYLFGAVMMTSFSNEMYRLSFTISISTIASAYLIVMAAAFFSGLLVRRRLDRLDLIAVLKTRE